MRLKTKFQDEDFELGEVVEGDIFYSGDIHQGFKVVAIAEAGGQHTFYYDTIKDFTDHWEDAPEEPKEFWCIEGSGYISSFFIDRIKEAGYSKDIEDYKEIGNYFESKEEAEKAVERLRAWKRLKEDLVSLHWQDEKDGKFSVWGQFNGNMLENDAILNVHRNDLDLLFRR